MAIHESIEKEIPVALRAGDTVRLRTLRSLFAAMTNEAIAKHARPSNEVMTFMKIVDVKRDRFLNDEEALGVLRRAAHERKDAIEMYQQAGRMNLVNAEMDELNIIKSYLPTQMSRDEILVLAKAKMTALGVTDKSGAGKFTGALMKELKDNADGADVRAVVDSLLP